MTTTDHSRYTESWLRHVRCLSVEIGPRGSTTEGERRGSEYCQSTLNQAGLTARMEAFTSARSIYLPHLLAAVMMLVAFVVYPLAGRVSAVLAAVLVVVSLSSELLELSFLDKTFTTVAFVLFLAQALLYILGSITQWAWIWPASIPSAVGALLLAAMCLQADRTPFSAGANDNATGAGLVLAMAGHLQAEPLQHTRVWLVCTGCEEVQHYGAIDFFRRHRADLQNPVAVVLESLGCAGPAWLTQEGIVVPFHADKDLVALVERLSADHPEWGAYPTRIQGGNTEMADALRAGIPAITFMGMGPHGETPYWHQVEDTFDKMDPEVMERAYAFIWAFAQALDAGEGQTG
jgi:hypothetical protein